MPNKVPQIVEQVLPAVVSVTVSKNLEYWEGPFRTGWGFTGIPTKKKKKMKVGGGSGFVVDKEGIILTNRHVVADSEAKYVVLLEDERKFEAEILARDPINDIAVLKIEAEDDFTTVALGNSSQLKLGEKVIAIGNALGRFSNTISTGVISGLSRNIKAARPRSRETQRLKNLVQTDAAVNPGNSGGPLVNMDGEAIGINAAMVHRAENIGFALPVNSTKKDLEQVKEYGRIRHPFLGVRYIPLNEKMKERYDLPVEHGALVVSEGSGKAVVTDSPADQAGFKQGDIVLKCNGRQVTPEQPLTHLLHECEIDQTTPFVLLRDGEKVKVKVTLVEKK